MDAIQSTLYAQAEALRNMANARHLTDEEIGRAHV